MRRKEFRLPQAPQLFGGLGLPIRDCGPTGSFAVLAGNDHMSGCYFRAVGDEFDVDAFLIGSSLDADGVYHKGEPMSPLRRTRPFTGFSITVSETWGDLRPQITDAIAFLREAELELSRLSSYPGVTDIRLDFACECHYVIQGYSLPPELLLLAGSLGITIELTIYDSIGELDGDSTCPDP